MSRVLATTPVVAPKALPEGLDPASLPRHIAVISAYAMPLSFKKPGA